MGKCTGNLKIDITYDFIVYVSTVWFMHADQNRRVILIVRALHPYKSV